MTRDRAIVTIEGHSLGSRMVGSSKIYDHWQRNDGQLRISFDVACWMFVYSSANPKADDSCW